MNYLTELQLKELIKHGFVPTEDKTTLTEVQQWFWEHHRVEIMCPCQKAGHIKTTVFYLECGDWEVFNEDEPFKNIPEALSWGIDEAIKQLND